MGHLGDECAVVDFLRMLGVGIERGDDGKESRYVTPLASLLKALGVVAAER